MQPKTLAKLCIICGIFSGYHLVLLAAYFGVSNTVNINGLNFYTSGSTRRNTNSARSDAMETVSGGTIQYDSSQFTGTNSSSVNMLELMPPIQTERQRTANTTCASLKKGNATFQKLLDLPMNRIAEFFVDRKYKIVYCSIPKVATTTWKRILFILSNQLNTSQVWDIPHQKVHYEYQKKYLVALNKLKLNEIMEILQTYYKIMIVREPLERILSAYRDKFATKYNKEFHKIYGKGIVKRFRTNPTNASLESGNDVKFSEFVRYIFDTSTGWPLNNHWRHFHEICLPCLINYDYIAKYETINFDSDAILQDVGAGDLVRFPTRGTSSHARRLLKDQYATVPNADILKLWEFYATDYHMFDYPFPGHLMHVDMNLRKTLKL